MAVQRPRPDTFLLKLRGSSEFHTERLDNPARLVVDLLKARRETRRTQYTFASSVLKKVRLGDQDNGVRAVFDLPSNAVQSDVRAVPGGVQVLLAHGASEAAANWRTVS